MKRSAYLYESYKDLMADWLTGPSNRGELTRAAKEINCQRSYLSRVILGELQLTPDHAFRLARYFRLNENEQLYFQTLVDFERASDPIFRNHLKSILQREKAKSEAVEVRTNRTQFAVDPHSLNYFSSWIFTAVHFLTSISAFQTVESIARRLSVSEDIVRHVLEDLKEANLVQHSNDRWRYASGEFHLPKQSPLVNYHHQNWRNRAMLDAQDVTAPGVHFTGVFTLSESDFKALKELVLQFISDAAKLAGPSHPEEAVAITCDFFKI